MKINRLEAHDRLLWFKKQADKISEGCQECIRRAPEAFKEYPFYIFAHKREYGTDEKLVKFNLDLEKSLSDPNYTRKYLRLADVPTHRLIWQPRLSKPTPQENSMLFRCFPNSDSVAVMWIIPDSSEWGQAKKGNVTESDVVMESIDLFINNPRKLAEKEPDDLSEELMKKILEEAKKEALRLKTSAGVSSYIPS